MTKDYSDSERGNPRVMDYSFRLLAKYILYALSRGQDSMYNGFVYVVVVYFNTCK